MNAEGENESELDADDDIAEEDTESTVVLSEDAVDDEDDDSSAEINVDKLVADIERLKVDAAMKRRLEARKRIDAMKDMVDEDDVFGSTYNFNLDDDLST